MAVFRQKRKNIEEPPQPFALETSGSCASTLSGVESFGGSKRRRMDQVHVLPPFHKAWQCELLRKRKVSTAGDRKAAARQLHLNARVLIDIIACTLLCSSCRFASDDET